MEGSVMGSKRLTPTRVGKNGLKMFVVFVVVQLHIIHLHKLWLSRENVHIRQVFNLKAAVAARHRKPYTCTVKQTPNHNWHTHHYFHQLLHHHNCYQLRCCPCWTRRVGYVRCRCAEAHRQFHLYYSLRRRRMDWRPIPITKSRAHKCQACAKATAYWSIGMPHC